MDKFRQAIEVVLKHEGGYVNDPLDRGGETNWGISKRSYPHLDIKNLTREEAIAIYRRDWWDMYNYELIDDATLATKVFDLAVNMGARQAHRLFQRALHAAGQRNVTVDGLIGPQTLAAANRANPLVTLGALRVEAAYYYLRIIERNPSQARFRNGWLKRAYS